MNKEFKQLIPPCFFSFEKCVVGITLNNQTSIEGELIGYFKDENAVINQLHIKPEIKLINLATDPFGYLQGVLINMKDIQQINFKNDNIIIKSTNAI